MQLKNKKRTMLALLSIMLFSTACASKSDYKDAPFSRINDILAEDPDILDDYYYDSVTKIYQTYISQFVDYMSKEQYNKFLIFADNMNNDELNEFRNTFQYLNDMFNVTDTSYGRGFYKTFNSCILSECVTYHGENGGALNNHVNNLCALVNIDVSLYKAIFSNDINKVIDSIMEITGYNNRDNLEELFLKMDLYYDLINSESYSDQTLMNSYDERIREIIGEIVEAKKERVEAFQKSLYARLLEESSYNGENTYTIIPSITKRTSTIIINDGRSEYTLENVPYEYLNGTYTIEEIKKFKVEEIINSGFKQDQNVYITDDTLYLMTCLFTSNPDFSRCNTSSDIRTKMYNYLSDYFPTEDEFNTFFLKLYSSSNSYEDYLKLFTKTIEENGISYNDFMRYNCLRNYLTSHILTHIEYPEYGEYLTKEQISKLKPEELPEGIYITKELVLIDKDMYFPYLNYIDGLFVNSNLPYDCMNNPDVTFAWYSGKINYVNEEKNQAISNRVAPKTLEYNGTNVVYYEYPKNYEDGIAIEVFDNIFDVRTTREIDGFRATIIDPDTGEEKVIFVVDMTSDLKTYPVIRFMADYETLKQKEDMKKSPSLYLGGTYE